MVVSLAQYHQLISIHRPLGILLLILVAIRFVNRLFSILPPFPATMSPQERFIAHWSEILMYTLLFLQPLVGWGMFIRGALSDRTLGWAASFPPPSA
jgi:cytochrome b561